MFLLTILHLTAFVAATDYGSFKQAVPHFVLPNRQKSTNIVYNFEQIRRDQPPHIEQRDESIASYMNKPKITTTAAPHILQSIPNFDDLLPKPHFPGLRTPHESQPWNYGSAFPSTIPPPPRPNWSNFGVDLNKQPFGYRQHELSSFTAPLQTPINHPNIIIPQQTYPSFAWSDRNSYDDRKIYIPKQPTVSAYANTAVELTTTLKPVSDVISQHQEDQQKNSAIPQLQNIRGNHKFNWNHVASEPQKVTTTSAATVNKSTPRAFPTLTPWHDGFGK